METTGDKEGEETGDGTNLDALVWEPTAKLRWIIRPPVGIVDGTMDTVLQQLWKNMVGDYKWKDVEKVRD